MVISVFDKILFLNLFRGHGDQQLGSKGAKNGKCPKNSNQNLKIGIVKFLIQEIRW